jgi:hypothetical protein
VLKKLVYILEQVNLCPKFFNSAGCLEVSFSGELYECVQRKQAYLAIREEFQSDFEWVVPQCRHHVNDFGVFKSE